jgi:hypothetical protein
MKIFLTTLLIFLSSNVAAGTIFYRCGNAYQADPCQGEFTKILIYKPATQEQKDLAEYARLKQDLIDSVDNVKLNTAAWQQFEYQRRIEAVKQAYYNDQLITQKRLANYQRARAILQFKHAREYQIHKLIKDQDNEMLDDMAWQSIQMRDDIVWHQLR